MGETSEPSIATTWPRQPETPAIQGWVAETSGYLKKAGTIAGKDLLAEWRGKEVISATLVFSLLTVVIFNFAFELQRVDLTTVAPGILWVAFTFSGTLGLNRSFAVEKDRGSLAGLMLAPVDRSAIYLGKTTANVLLMFITEAILLPMFAVFFNMSMMRLVAIIPIVLLGTVGFVAVGTLLAAVAMHTRAREVMLPVLLFPMLMPVIIVAVQATGRILQGDPLSALTGELGILLAYDAILFVVAWLSFEFVVEA
ncbi:MAG: heme exporter protein CcmB [Anaerolineae bacterium]